MLDMETNFVPTGTIGAGAGPLQNVTVLGNVFLMSFFTALGIQTARHVIGQ